MLKYHQNREIWPRSWWIVLIALTYYIHTYISTICNERNNISNMWPNFAILSNKMIIVHTFLCTRCIERNNISNMWPNFATLTRFQNFAIDKSIYVQTATGRKDLIFEYFRNITKFEQSEKSFWQLVSCHQSDKRQTTTNSNKDKQRQIPTNNDKW